MPRANRNAPMLRLSPEQYQEKEDALETQAMHHLNASVKLLDELFISNQMTVGDEALLSRGLQRARAARAVLEVIHAQRLPMHYDHKAAAAHDDQPE